MPRILKQTQAEQDLVEIWLYTFNEWGNSKQIIAWWLTFFIWG